jgi:hypothetical protein
MNFSSFADFTAHYRLSMEAFRGQLLEETGLSDEDRQGYFRMVARLGAQWLVRSNDFEALTLLRDQIIDVLRGSTTELKGNYQ